MAIKDRVNSLVRKHKFTSRGIYIDGDRLTLSIEARKSTPGAVGLIKDIEKQGLRKVNITYGRWVFQSRYDDLDS